MVRAREQTPPPPESAAPKAALAQEPGAPANAPLQALVVKGSPPQAKPRQLGGKVLMGLGAGLAGVALALLLRLRLHHRVKPTDRAQACKDDLRVPEELLFKEPVTDQKARG